jgi:hypothetical protein
MATAKNVALDTLRRQRTAPTFAPDLGQMLQSEWTLVPVMAELFAPNAIKDDLLRMMFSCDSFAIPQRNVQCQLQSDTKPQRHGTNSRDAHRIGARWGLLSSTGAVCDSSRPYPARGESAPCPVSIAELVGTAPAAETSDSTTGID